MIVIKSNLHLDFFDDITMVRRNEGLTEKLEIFNESFNKIKKLIEFLSKNIDFIKNVIKTVIEKDTPYVKEIKENISGIDDRTKLNKLKKLTEYGLLLAIDRTEDGFKIKTEAKMKKSYVINPYFESTIDNFLEYLKRAGSFFNQFEVDKKKPPFKGISGYFKWLINNKIIEGIDYPEIIDIKLSSSKILRLRTRCNECMRNERYKDCYNKFYYLFKKYFEKFSSITDFNVVMERGLFSHKFNPDNQECIIEIKFP